MGWSPTKATDESLNGRLTLTLYSSARTAYCSNRTVLNNRFAVLVEWEGMGTALAVLPEHGRGPSLIH
jgi:hypothetical protein